MIYLIIILLIGAFLFYVSTRPDVFLVSRSEVMNASQETVFGQVNDLLKWKAWSPWEKMDPGATGAIEGPTYGTGARVSWKGKKTGEGNMLITESEPYSRIVMRLEFIKPMKAINQTVFTFTPEGSGTRMTWTMSGPNTFIGKLVSFFMDCDKMVGNQFEEGLASIKQIVETKD